MVTYSCELAWLGGRVVEEVALTVEGERITAVTGPVPRPQGSERLAGLTLPGLVDAHSHAFHRALRGRTQGGAGDFWTWREAMYSLADRLDPDLLFALARAAFAELVLGGVTTVGEFHYLHHEAGGRAYADPNTTGLALVAAAAEAGIRLTLLDTCYLHAAPGRPLTGTQLRFGDDSAQAWAERWSVLPEGPQLRRGAAIHSVRAVDPEAAAVVAQAAGGRPLHVHLSEQPAENEQCRQAYGMTPTQVLAAAGALGPHTTAVHATHLTDADIDLLAGSGTAVCLCPTTERELADGIGPAGALVAAGVPLCVGSDSHAVADLFEEARGIELDERLASLRRGTHSPMALLAAATANGAAALGWPEAGVLAPGRLADLCTVAMDTPRTAGVLPEAVVFAATAADVHHVVVGGRVVVRDGRHLLGLGHVGGLLAAAIGRAWA